MRLLRQSLTQALWQIGHGREIVGQVLVEPVVDLAGAKRRLAPLDHPLLQLRKGKREQVDLLIVMNLW